MKRTLKNLRLFSLLFILAFAFNKISAQNKKLPLCINVKADFLQDSISLIVTQYFEKKGFSVISNQEKERLMQKRMEEIMSRVFKEKITDESRIQKLMVSGSAVANRLILNLFITQELNNNYRIDSVNYIIQPVLGKDFSKLPIVNTINKEVLNKDIFMENIFSIAELIATKEQEKKE
ncbi:MAG: hypothetical protein ACKVOW_20935 [Chitinophagaceae bacterium]